MSTLSILVPSLVAVGVLLVLSAFFSSSESAIFSLPAEAVGPPASDATPDRRALQALRADPHRLLVTLLVGNNIVNIAITSIVTLLVAGFVPAGFTVPVATLVVSVLVLLFGEIVPKSYGLGHAETWSLRVARPITLVERVLGPLVSVFDAVTRGLTSLVGGDRSIERPYVEE